MLCLHDYSHGIDTRRIPSIAPESYINETARVIEEEMATRIEKLKEKIDLGTLDESLNGRRLPSSVWM